MRLVRTWCKIPTRDSKEVGPDLTHLQALQEHKALREKWSKGLNRFKPTNYVLKDYANPWRDE
jgi:hypothetical protein